MPTPSQYCSWGLSQNSAERKGKQGPWSIRLKAAVAVSELLMGAPSVGGTELLEVGMLDGTSVFSVGTIISSSSMHSLGLEDG